MRWRGRRWVIHPINVLACKTDRILIRDNISITISQYCISLFLTCLPFICSLFQILPTLFMSKFVAMITPQFLSRFKLPTRRIPLPMTTSLSAFTSYPLFMLFSCKGIRRIFNFFLFSGLFVEKTLYIYRWLIFHLILSCLIKSLVYSNYHAKNWAVKVPAAYLRGSSS